MKNKKESQMINYLLLKELGEKSREIIDFKLKNFKAEGNLRDHLSLLSTF